MVCLLFLNVENALHLSLIINKKKGKEVVHNITILSLILLINLPYWLWHALVLGSEGLIALLLLPSSIEQPVDQWQLLLNEHVMMGEPGEKGTNKSLIRALSGSSHCLLSECSWCSFVQPTSSGAISISSDLEDIQLQQETCTNVCAA